MKKPEEKEMTAESLLEYIKSQVDKYEIYTVSTCDIARLNAWSLKEYNLMPEITRRLTAQGYRVQQERNFEVNDFIITNTARQQTL